MNKSTFKLHLSFPLELKTSFVICKLRFDQSHAEEIYLINLKYICTWYCGSLSTARRILGFLLQYTWKKHGWRSLMDSFSTVKRRCKKFQENNLKETEKDGLGST